MFKISYYRDGRLIVKKYDSRAQAEKVAQLVFKRSGIIVGIEAV